MSSNKLKGKMMSLKKWAVVGVSGNKDKFGYKIWKTLKEHGYTTYGISPNYDELEGDRIYKSLSELPEKVDIIDMVVPPRLSITILEEAKENGIEYVFFQPGTYNDEVVAKAEELGLKFLTDDCVYATLKKGAH